jgi:outer membrane protein TolC
LFAGTACACLILFVSCSTTHYQKSADKEAYKAIADKAPAVPGMDPNFTIEGRPLPSLEDLPAVKDDLEFLGELRASEVGARILTLEKALALAVQHNRKYLAAKEALYLQALNLTLERHRYRPIFSGGANAKYNRTTREVQSFSNLAQAVNDAPDLLDAVGDLAGTPGALLDAYANLIRQAGDVTGITAAHTDVIDERSVAPGASFGMDALLKGGGRIAVDLTSNFLRFITGDPRANATTALLGTFIQPLWRGAGAKVAAERLTQAERDLLYELRSFARFRQEFTVQICQGFYRVLQTKDIVINNYETYKSFLKNAEREKAFAAEGKRTIADLFRLEQAQLTNENEWTSSIRNYKQALDQFKIDIGFSADTPIVLDDNELRLLKEAGLQHPNLKVEDSQKVALAARLDIYTQRDQAQDAGRKLAVAKNGLKPGLDLVAGATIPSAPGNKFMKFDTERATWNAGINTDLPIDRKSERNSYRAAVIAEERAKRELTLAEDTIKLQIRDAWRSLDQARTSFEVAKKQVQLNESRVEEQDLLAELGRAVAQNQVDARNDLNRARNALTAALVGHTMARLQFWRDTGILYIKENGQWEEVKDVQP